MSSRRARREREPTRINKFYIYTNFIDWYMYYFYDKIDNSPCTAMMLYNAVYSGQ